MEQQVDRNKHPSGIVPVLQNVVSTVNLGCKLELKEIALHAHNAEYNPKVRAGRKEGWSARRSPHPHPPRPLLATSVLPLSSCGFASPRPPR